MNPIREEDNIIHENVASHSNTFGEKKPCCFYKLILSPISQSKKLRIPEKFARTYREELSTASILKVPTGETHKVAVVEKDNNLWFHDGWQEFVEYFSIGYAFFLLFKYHGDSNFMVHIFNPTACEISYQCNARNVLKPQHEAGPQEIDDDAEDDKDSMTSLHSSPVNLKNSDLEVIQLDSDDEETNDIREGTSFGYHYKLGNYDEIMNAVAAAGISLPERPFFLSDIKPYSLYRGSFLNIPVHFGRYHLKCRAMQSKFIKLMTYGGRQLTVKCIRNRNKCTFGSGWIIFARVVGLEVGDVCVFELTDATNFVLNVQVAKKSRIKAAPGQFF